MIEVRNINKTFGEKHVLKNISASFEKGNAILLLVPVVVENLY